MMTLNQIAARFHQLKRELMATMHAEEFELRRAVSGLGLTAKECEETLAECLELAGNGTGEIIAQMADMYDMYVKFSR
jgi:hypothetical protein